MALISPLLPSPYPYSFSCDPHGFTAGNFPRPVPVPVEPVPAPRVGLTRILCIKQGQIVPTVPVKNPWENPYPQCGCGFSAGLRKVYPWVTPTRTRGKTRTGCITRANYYSSDSGWTALCLDHNQFAINNGTDGFDLYQMDDTVYVCTFQTRILGLHKPKQVLFAEGAQVIMGSSDHGVVYIFDHRTREVLDTLDHAKKGVIQAIAAHNEARNTIVCASSGNNIIVWTYEAEWPARGTREKRTMGGRVWPANSTFPSWMGIHANWGSAKGNGYVVPAPRTTIIKEAHLRVQESHHTDDETVQKVVDRVMKALAEMLGIKTRAKQRGT
ncbi:hypothetical protein BD779DRAFT_1474706 [Infundibulicybe gibba]|nr:hypothetical protein BD779DRAFT_1474706 [Infundibulicybe gibba]